MSSANQQTPNSIEQPHPVYWPDGDNNARSYTMMNNVPINTHAGASQEQQIVYYNTPVNYAPFNYPQSYAYPQQWTNGLNRNQCPTISLPAQQYQQQSIPVYSNIPSSLAIPPLMHTNASQAQVSSYQVTSNSIAQPFSTMINTAVSSTPISSQTKRGRNDTSGISESNIQLRPKTSHTTDTISSNKTPYKRHRTTNQQDEATSIELNGKVLLNRDNHDNRGASNSDQLQPSTAACRFATSRFPFAPFTVIFTQEVHEKKVLDDLITHARNNCNFELKTVAYRRGRTVDNEYRVLIFVENSESFVFLYNTDNWPTSLASNQFTFKTPSIPPQLALVLPVVSLQTDWDEFVKELKDIFPSLVNVIRLKNKMQQPVRAVKLEFLSSKVRSEILDAGEIAVMHMKFKVVEYFSQANVLICSNCCGIGHFRKNCPQKEEFTCKTCGEKCQDLKDHPCSGVPKCIHCGGPHSSNDQKCKVVKDYRAALTRNLLSKEPIPIMNDVRAGTIPVNPPTTGSMTGRQLYATAARSALANSNEVISKKLDAILFKMEEEATATRKSFELFKEETRKQWEEATQKMDVLDMKIKIVEKKFEDFSMRTSTIVQNICTALLDPHGAEGETWKTYWKEQIKMLKEYRSTNTLIASAS